MSADDDEDVSVLATQTALAISPDVAAVVEAAREVVAQYICVGTYESLRAVTDRLKPALEKLDARLKP